MSKLDDDTRRYDTAGWPGPVGWWYLPLFWLVVLFVASLAWSFN